MPKPMNDMNQALAMFTRVGIFGIGVTSPMYTNTFKRYPIPKFAIPVYINEPMDTGLTGGLTERREMSLGDTFVKADTIS